MGAPYRQLEGMSRFDIDLALRDGASRLVTRRRAVVVDWHAVYRCCMSATRTQVYLTEEQRARIDRAAAARGVTMAEVIRNAIDEYVGDECDPAATLRATFGAAPSADSPSRDSWQRG